MVKRKGAVSVRKIREILRLSHLGFSQRRISDSCGLARSTVGEYQARAKALGIDWDSAEELNDDELVLRFRPATEPIRHKHEPDYKQVHADSKRKGVTLFLLWEEYNEKHSGNCYSYSQFCRHYRSWRQQRSLSMPQEHKAGEKVFVDYAGMKIPIYKCGTDEVEFEASLFIGALGASSYIFAEATKDEELQSWLGSHCRMFTFYAGVVEIIVPDNLKTGVTRSCYYEPDINPSYHALAQHYGTCVIPARVRKPKDKAKAESAVQVAEQRILAKIRNIKFYNLAELNSAISALLTELNNRLTKRFPESRRVMYEQVDLPALNPLPSQTFPYAQEKTAKVNIDYHITFERHHYSVPYKLVREQVQLRVLEKTIEILHKGQRIALHLRSSKLWGYTTCPEHMPPSHKAMNEEWSPKRFINWARKYGSHTVEITTRILNSQLHPEQAYRSVLGLLRLEKKYDAQRLEAACKRAHHLGLYKRKHVLNILENKQEMLPLPEPSAKQEVLLHDNIRGSNYYH
jgi:transposase